MRAIWAPDGLVQPERKHDGVFLKVYYLQVEQGAQAVMASHDNDRVMSNKLKPKAVWLIVRGFNPSAIAFAADKVNMN